MNIKDWLGEDNQIGIDIWENKYRYKNETFDEWLERVSAGNKDLKQLIVDKKFLFAGRVLANRGVDENATYSNCYVLQPPEDNLESIFDTAKEAARTFSYGGGVGFDLSNLAPKGAKVNNTAKSTSGAVSFMDLYSLVTGLIGQNGRRGALMLSMSVDHPDIEEFIKCKTDLNRVTKANISVRVTDDFMNAVKDDKNWDLKYTRKETGEEIHKTVKARDLFRLICETANNYAEPGVLFWDNICNNHMMSNHPQFEYAGTNPCGEEPLPAGGACNLGAINLAEFVINEFTDEATINWNELAKTIKVSVYALNDLLYEGLERHPLQYQKETVAKWKQIGLGTMGLADMLIKLGLTYGSDKACFLVDELYEFIAKKAFLASEDYIFDNFIDIKETFDRSKTLYYKCLFGDEYHSFNNSQVLTIAPTGTLSTMLGISGGIEPIFANSYQRKTETLHGEDVYYKVYTSIVKKYMDEYNITDEKDLPEYFVTAKDIDYYDRQDLTFLTTQS